jgi:hypothetical protein
MTQYDLEHANLYADGPTATDYRGRRVEALLYPPQDCAATDKAAEISEAPQIASQGQE